MSKPENPRLFDLTDLGVRDGYIAIGTNMTLRDLFAAFALAGLLSDHTMRAEPKDFAEWAYVDADAMLAERAKR